MALAPLLDRLYWPYTAHSPGSCLCRCFSERLSRLGWVACGRCRCCLQRWKVLQGQGCFSTSRALAVPGLLLLPSCGLLSCCRCGCCRCCCVNSCCGGGWGGAGSCTAQRLCSLGCCPCLLQAVRLCSQSYAPKAHTAQARSITSSSSCQTQNTYCSSMSIRRFCMHVWVYSAPRTGVPRPHPSQTEYYANVPPR